MGSPRLPKARARPRGSGAVGRSWAPSTSPGSPTYYSFFRATI